MGCQSTKIKERPTPTPAKTNDEECQMEVDQHEIQIDPKIQVTNQACGYRFSVQQQMVQNSSRDMQLPELATEAKLEYERCKYYYQQHNIDMAWLHGKNLKELLHRLESDKKLGYNNKALVQLLEIKDIRELDALLQKVFEEYQDVITFQQEIEKGGWVEKSNKKGVRICIRREGDTVGSLIQSDIETPFEVFISILIEMDLYKEFIPFVKVSEQEKQVARNCRIGYSQNHIPFISVREAFFQGIGYNRLEKNGSLFLLTRSIHNREDLQQKLGYQCKPNKNFVQLQYKYFVLKYEPTRRGLGKLTIAMNVNPKLDFLPMWVLEKVSEDFGQDFLKNVLKVSKKFKGSKWQQNVKNNPHLFNFFKTCIDGYLTKAELQKKLEQKK